MCLGVDERGMGQNGGMGRRPAFCFEDGSVAWGKRKREGGSGGHICMEEGGEGGCPTQSMDGARQAAA
jgi:hypothetical protein